MNFLTNGLRGHRNRRRDQERIGRTDTHQPNTLPFPELDSILSPGHPKRIWRPQRVPSLHLLTSGYDMDDTRSRRRVAV